MKYLVIARRRETVKTVAGALLAAKEYVNNELKSGRADCVYLFSSGDGSGICEREVFCPGFLVPLPGRISTLFEGEGWTRSEEPFFFVLRFAIRFVLAIRIRGS